MNFSRIMQLMCWCSMTSAVMSQSTPPSTTSAPIASAVSSTKNKKTPKPTPSPTQRGTHPTAIPSVVPVSPSVIVPTASPAKKPTSKPVQTPMQAPMQAPVQAPMQAPIPQPAPIPAPILAPVTPVGTPTANTMSPSLAPVSPVGTPTTNTMSPSISPVAVNISAISSMPTLHANTTGSDAPSRSPFLRTTRKPSLFPTQFPTEFPTKTNSSISIVNLPEITLGLILSSDSTFLSVANESIVDGILNSFLSEVLQNASDEFISVVVVSSAATDSTGTTIVRASGTVDIQPKSNATSSSVSQILTGSFEEDGSAGLRSMFNQAGIPVQDMRVTIDGTTVSDFASDRGTSSAVQGDKQATATTETDGRKLSNGAIAGMAVGIAFVGVFLAAFFQGRSRRREVFSDIADSTLGAQRNEAADRALNWNKPNIIEELHSIEIQSIGSGMISGEESLFTSDNAPQPTDFRYDASRLDEVISSAKGFAKDMK